MKKFGVAVAIWYREIKNDLTNNGIEINLIGINLIYLEIEQPRKESLNKMERYYLDKCAMKNTTCIYKAIWF